MRLRRYRADCSRLGIAATHGDTEISERHRHRYEVNTAYRAP
jgi:CTP synthase